MLLARPLCHILEPIVARRSKSLPTPGIGHARFELDVNIKESS